MTFGVVGQVATLDPYSPAASDLTYALTRPIYPSLFRFLPDGTTEPSLAESVDADGRTALVELRRAQWSDGRPITARDVAASIRRALPPSGFARIGSARVLGSRLIELRGSVKDWPRALATVAFVMPKGEPAPVAGGPFGLKRKVRGLEFAYAPNPRYWGDEPLLERITVRFVQGLDLLLELLRRRRLDAALVPSSVNIADRLDAIGVAHREVLGWESVVLDLATDTDRTTARALWGNLARARIESGFVRDLGRVANTLRPVPGRAGAAGPFSALRPAPAPRGESLALAAPVGDELLELVQRALLERLSQASFDVELLGVEPLVLLQGDRWVTVERVAGAPGLSDPPRAVERPSALPLFHVATVLAWREGVRGLQVNPTFEGPLWNAERWWKEGEGGNQ
ncbi:MAG: ABC transporter substrate-binding protein [Actinomycetota bacterium]